MEQPIRILHLEDDPSDRELVVKNLGATRWKWQITSVQTGPEFEEALHRGGYDVILADFRLPMYDGMSALRLTQELCPDIPFIFVSGTMGEDAAIEGLTKGATDYVLKQKLSRLAPAIKRALAEAENRRERKRAEEAVAAEKERLDTTLRCIGDGVITTDTLGAIVIINNVAEMLTGWTQSEAAGKPLAEVLKVINESTRQPCENLVEKVLSTGDSVELANHTILISRDGTERMITDSGAPIKNADNKTIGVVLVFRDITEKQKLLENAQRTDKLEAIGILAGGIAHDFNNLLCGIFGYIDLATETCNSESKTADYLEKAMKTFSRAKNLTYQLLTFAKGGVPVLKTGSLIPIIKESTQFALSGSSTAALFTIADDLWLCDFDENQFAQIIDNLVINAVQAMPCGGTITVNAENIEINQGENSYFKQGKYVHLSFADTGVGIPPIILSRIFDPFFTTKQKGNGLGLATVYSIIKKHDGKITVNSKPGKGTTFHIYLPASEKTTATQTTGTVYAHKGTGRILIMDDEKYIREVVGDMLKSMGYSIEYAVHGDEAIEMTTKAFRTKKPYVAAILDLTIPGGKGGKETIKQLKKIDWNLVTFVSSGYSEDPVMANPAEYGFADRLIKPFTKAELAEILDRHLTSKRPSLEDGTLL